MQTSYDRAGVACRLRDSLDQLECAGEPLDGWQSDMLARAIACLQTGMYILAVDAASRACLPYLYRSRAAAIVWGDSPKVTVAELRAELDRVLANSAS
jgi:hypothetical protein